MVHCVNTFEGIFNVLWIANVSCDQFNIRVQVFGSLAVFSVYLLAEVVQYPHFVTFFQKFIRQVGADKTGSTRNQYLFHNVLALYRGVTTYLKKTVPLS